ncbi:hypothetical protein ACEWY4_001245 [Coilia grayii]|uniref:GRF-type domain-containing protein n=1 Tax=Coilia grayii TaxID=363190 RepID=A0ABD1KYZ6_9TELE
MGLRTTSTKQPSCSSIPRDSATGDQFEDSPGRKWLNCFLFGATEEEQKCDQELYSSSSQKPAASHGGKFVDTFRFFHPSRPQAFTCWSMLTGARQTNYGTRIDYIFANRSLAETLFLGADIMPEVVGSDHCPVWGQLGCEIQPSPRCPSICTCYMPEFAGKQQKLSRFLVKMANQHPEIASSSEAKQVPLPGSQETEEIRENLSPLCSGVGAGRKRGLDGIAESSVPKVKKSKVAKTAAVKPKGLLAFFKPKGPSVEQTQNASNEITDRTKEAISEPTGSSANGHANGNRNSLQFSSPDNNEHNMKDVCKEVKGQELANVGARPLDTGDSKKGMCPGFWKTVLRGPPQPPPCKVHREPCVLRTVKKAGPNMGRQFFVCARPQGHASNPQARCNFFAWVDKGR